jgi:type II secretory pathway component PulK
MGGMLCRAPKVGHQTRRGVVLIAVLIVVVVLTLAAYQFSDLMMAESRAATSYVRYAQARALAESGIAYAAVMLSNPDTFTSTLNSNPYSNPTVFQDVPVGDPGDSGRQGRFSVIAPPSPDDVSTGSATYRYGVTDESGKLNLNTLLSLDSSGQTALNVLLNLPNMTEDIANSILDWMDPDDTSRANGAENDYYASLSPPYQAKNGPLDTLDELLLVKGVTPQYLYGNDFNRNGILDPEEDDGTGVLDQGWSAYLTIYSRERNISSQGTPRIYLNDTNLSNLYENLSAINPDLANFIVAYRTYGPASTPSSGTSGRTSSGGNTPATTTGSTTPTSAKGPLTLSRNQRASMISGAGRGTSISSIYSLINASVSIPASSAGQRATVYASPLNDPAQQAQLLPLLLDQTTTSQAAEIPARVNVNSAPSAVLQSLPNLSDADIQSILNNRPSPDSTDPPDPIFQTTAWLLTRANISASTLQSLEQYITAGSQVYRVQSVGYFDGGGPTVRVEAVIDTNGGRPRVISFRDLTELGKGYNLQSGQP